MEILKKLLLFAGTTIAAVFLIIWCLNSFGFRSPFFAFLANWIAMAWVAITDLGAHVTLPRAYYDIKPFERTGQMYERLGIVLFRSLVGRGPLSMFSPTLELPKERVIPALHFLAHQTRKAETGHLLSFLLILLFSGYALFRGWFDAVAWLMVFNVPINGYPIMLQRYNRIKLQELIQR